MSVPVQGAAAGTTPLHGFPKSARLRRRREFLEVQRGGVRTSTTHFTFLLVPSSSAQATARLGITASRHVGNAVQRNRVKRLVREVFRHHRGWLPVGCDVVVVARAGAPRLTRAALGSEWEQAQGALQRQAERVLAGEGQSNPRVVPRKPMARRRGART